MALTASLPVIEDLAMKFNRHTLHDSFQLPSYYQYPGNWQAKEFALYLQPNSHRFIVEPELDQVAPFEFKAIGNFTTKQSKRNKVQPDRASAISRHSPRRQSTTEQGKSSKSQTVHTNPAANTDRKEIPSCSAVKTLDFDEDCLSDDEELSCYFSNKHLNDTFVQKPSTSSSTRSHNRKRSMEDDDCLTIKRCCRPRLNFDKMLMNSRDVLDDACTNEEDTTNYFRPISPHDSPS